MHDGDKAYFGILIPKKNTVRKKKGKWDEVLEVSA